MEKFATDTDVSEKMILNGFTDEDEEGNAPMKKLTRATATVALTALALCLPGGTAFAAYEIGDDLSREAFWRSDPVLFVRQHVDDGFQFTSDQRDGADSRRDDGVTCFGLPVYESRVAFADGGGVARVELTLYGGGGTEAVREFTGGDGRTFRRLERVEKTMTREEFFAALKTARARLTAKGKPPAATDDGVRKDTATVQKAQTWPKTAIPTQATLVWNYAQRGKDEATFEPGFIRLSVDGPSRLAAGGAAAGRAAKKAAGAKKVSDNVVRDPRGDVFIDGLPMVDQGRKGYCSVATAERVLRYYGVDVDEHELAAAAGTSAESGTSTRAMKEAVEAIGRRYKLGTVVCYGDFEKGARERIAGIVDEVRAYNKAAKKLKKPAIADDAYVRREGNVTYYSPSAVDAAMDVEVRKEMRVNGAQKAKYTKFRKDVRDQVAKGIPLFWGVTLGIYPEPDNPQASGGHMRLVIGYNDKKNEILYTDSWGAGHELKRMPFDWAWTISHCLLYMKPLGK